MSQRDEGFTLVELIVVVAIIGVLAAIAMVALIHAKEPAIDRSAQSLLDDAVKTVRIVASDGQDLGGITRADLVDAEHSVNWRDETISGESAQHEVSVAIGTSAGVGYVILSTHTSNGDCLAVRQTDAPTLYQRVAGDMCPANAFDPAFGWVAQWPPR